MPRDVRDHELLVAQFIEDFGRLFEGFQEDISSLNNEIVGLRTEAEHHHEDIKRLSKVVVDGNPASLVGTHVGRPPRYRIPDRHGHLHPVRRRNP